MAFMSIYMDAACHEARRGMDKGDGGPFGAVIVKDGAIISTGHNMVLSTTDSTAHAEVVAIRMAEKVLGTHDLTGCEMYATCYPCPMCLGAVLWSRISKLHYGCTPEEAAAIGFDDARFWVEIRAAGTGGLIDLVHQPSESCALLFRSWEKKEDRHMY